jgi:hypothetical protein
MPLLAGASPREIYYGKDNENYDAYHKDSQRNIESNLREPCCRFGELLCPLNPNHGCRPPFQSL